MNPNMREFERDTFLKEEAVRLVKKHGIQTVIETGTEYGGTANAFSEMVPQVFTMDIKRKFNNGDLRPNVRFLLGDSRNVLKKAIVLSKAPVLFFLDAHSSIDTDPCPLRDELAIISLLANGSPVILVHDCQVPGTDLGFDSYKGKPISWEMVSDIVPTIFPMGFTRYFNSNADGSRRGVLFIEPNWSAKSCPHCGFSLRVTPVDLTCVNTNCDKRRGERGLPHLSKRVCTVCGTALVTNGESHCPNENCERAMRVQ